MFTKDSRTENFLTQMGVSFEYTNSVSFSDLSLGWESENIARPVPLREDAIFEYAALMESGSAAPAPILLKAKGGHFVLDGVQRLSAAKLSGDTKLSAYVVTCDSDDLIAAIRVLANARLQGRPEPPEWTRRRAVEVLVVQRGLSIEEVARMGGWKPSDISRLAGTIDWNGKIQSVGGPELTDSMVEVVSKYMPESELSSSAGPVVEFLKVIKSAKFSASDAEPYVREFFAPISKQSKRYRIYTERLDEFKAQPEVQTRIHGRRGASMRRDVVLGRTLKSAITLIDEIVADGDEIPYIDEFFRLLKVIDKKLKSVSPHKSSAKVPVSSGK